MILSFFHFAETLWGAVNFFVGKHKILKSKKFSLKKKDYFPDCFWHIVILCPTRSALWDIGNGARPIHLPTATLELISGERPGRIQFFVEFKLTVQSASVKINSLSCKIFFHINKRMYSCG